MEANFKKAFPYFLLGYHLLFSYFAWQYVTENNGDAMRYWFLQKDLEKVSWIDFFKPGTDIIKLITFPLVKLFHLPFWVGFVIFSFISFWGFYFLWKLLLKISNENFSLTLSGSIILLLPNVHFWTSLIGKESILFLCLTIIAIEIIRENFRSWKLIIGFLLLLLIRPHIAGLLIFSGLITILFFSKLNSKKKWLLLGLGIFLLFFSAFVLQNVASGHGNLIQKISQLYDAHIRVLKRTDAYVPLDQYVFPYKLFTFYFRPLPWENPGFLYQIISWENFICLGVTLFATFIFFKFYKKIDNRKFLAFSCIFIFIFASMYVFAYTNFGLILRTKIMVFPFGFLLLMIIVNYKFAIKPISNKEKN